MRAVLADDPSMQALRERYATALTDKRSTLLAQWRAWRASEGGLTHLRELRMQAHRLAGSAGCYGYALVGERANHLDTLAGEALDRPEALEQPQLDQAVTALLAALDSAIAGADRVD